MHYTIALAALWLAATALPAAASRCHGSVGNGRIDGSVRLPLAGPNFGAYSREAVDAGRTHVHATVAAIVADAYAALQRERPQTHYVYGETGAASGGPFAPHRTHQNGLSVDFFVPVLDHAGRSRALPSTASNRYGYDIEFDADARYGDYRVDFPALAEHLYQLQRAASAHEAGIALVIFDRAWLPRLWATPRGPALRRQLRFMPGTPWVRHDEHYHVDFAIACEPLAATTRMR